MNIFMCDTTPRACAQALDDKRLNKMTIETGQILSTTMSWYNDNHLFTNKPPYRTVHIHHPCCIWARSPENYHWLCLYLKELGTEWLFRGNKPHSTLAHITIFESIIPDIKNDGPSLVTNPTCIMAGAPAHSSLQDGCRWTLNQKWMRDQAVPTWYKRGKPAWANFVRPMEAAYRNSQI